MDLDGLTSWCAAAALLQNANVTTFALQVLSLTRFRISSDVLEVIWSSSGVNHPEVSGKVVTSSCSCEGKISLGINHSVGILLSRAARLAAAMFSHSVGGEMAMVTEIFWASSGLQLERNSLLGVGKKQSGRKWLNGLLSTT